MDGSSNPYLTAYRATLSSQAPKVTAPKATSSGGITGFIKNAVSSIVKPIVNTGENAFNVINASGAQAAQTAHLKDAQATLQQISQNEQNGKVSHQTAVQQRNDVMKSINSINNNTNKTVATSQAINPTKAAADAANT